MDKKVSGIGRFLAPSLNKIEEELSAIHTKVNGVNARMEETLNRLEKLEEDYKRLAARIDKNDNGMTIEAKVLFDSINEMERQNRDEVDVLKRTMDVTQRRLSTLESKMKELGK